MLLHHFTGGAPKWSFSRHHFPKRDTKRVQIRPGVQCQPGELFGASKFCCSNETSWRRNCSLKTRFSDRLRQTEIDNFCRNYAVILQTHHDVTRFDISMNELLFVHCSQTG